MELCLPLSHWVRPCVDLGIMSGCVMASQSFCRGHGGAWMLGSSRETG